MAELVNMLQGQLFQFLLLDMDKEARGLLRRGFHDLCRRGRHHFFPGQEQLFGKAKH